MAAPFFYEKNLPDIAGHFTLSDETSKHCVQVLRMEAGETISLTNGLGLRYIATILSPDKKKTIVQLMEREYFERPIPVNEIAISFVKNPSRMEWFLEKATEIGIAAIYPLIATRTERTNFKADRWEGILISAMLQSQQVWKPVMHLPLAVVNLLEQPFSGTRLIAHCTQGAKTALQNSVKSSKSLILIGPEGDFTPDEVSYATNRGCVAVSLGNTRLRTETAGIVAAVIMQNQ